MALVCRPRHPQESGLRSCASGEVHLQSSLWARDNVRGTVLTRSLGWRTRSPRVRTGPRRTWGKTNLSRGAHNRPALVWGDDERGAQVRSVRCDVVGLAQFLPTVRQQLVDPLRRMGADPIEHIAEVSLRVDSQILARCAQADQDGRRLASLVASGE